MATVGYLHGDPGQLLMMKDGSNWEGFEPDGLSSTDGWAGPMVKSHVRGGPEDAWAGFLISTFSRVVTQLPQKICSTGRLRGRPVP